MPTVRARRTVGVAPAEAWRLLGDPHQLPRWWPRAVRVEDVRGGEFTLVMTSSRGREVRADQRVVVSDRPRRRAWALAVEGTPFASVFVSSEVEVRLEPAGEDGTRIVLSQRQRLRGAARLGAPLVRAGVRRQLRAALAAAAAELEG